MKLTLAEKTVIGTIIFQLLILLTIGATQIAINQTGVDLHYLLRSSPSPTLTPELSGSEIDTNDIIIEEPQPTTEQTASTKQTSWTWLGWVLIIGSSLLIIVGIGLKFLRS